jgi:lipopolysaccharide transport system permease protein
MATLSSARNVPIREALDPRNLVADLWRHRGLVGQMAVREFNQRYRATSLGMLWAVVQPLMMLAVYTFVFSYVFNARLGRGEDENRVDFALAIYAGLLVFGLFSGCVSQSATSIVSQPNYVKKVVFPLQTLPVSVALSNLILTGINLALLCLFSLLFRGGIPLTALLVPLILAPVTMLSMGLGYFLAALGVYVRDVEHVVAIVLQVLFFMTPIFYSLDSLKNLPGFFRVVIHANPLAPMVESARGVLLWGAWPDWGWFLIALAFSGLTLQLGYAWFVKTRGGFADVL